MGAKSAVLTTLCLGPRSYEEAPGAKQWKRRTIESLSSHPIVTHSMYRLSKDFELGNADGSYNTQLLGSGHPVVAPPYDCQPRVTQSMAGAHFLTI